MEPIFLISLPRSGSTLLQRMLTVSSDVHSVAEPWLMLPLGFIFERDGILAAYNHKYANKAIHEFIDTFPNGKKDFLTALQRFVISLYRTSQSDLTRKKYFLDKTPRYYLIVPFLSELFPNAKFIFLFRNPLAVLSSILTSWLDNKLATYRYHIDIFYGPRALSEGFNLLRDRSIAIHYNDLVLTTEFEIKKICRFLEIEFQSEMITCYKDVKFQGKMGDQIGINRFESVSPQSIGKWKIILNTRYRKWLSKRYVKQLGDKVLRDFGTTVDELSHEIESIQQTRPGSVSDVIYYTVSNLKRLIYIEYYKKLLKAYWKKKPFYHPM